MQLFEALISRGAEPVIRLWLADERDKQRMTVNEWIKETLNAVAIDGQQGIDIKQMTIERMSRSMSITNRPLIIKHLKKGDLRGVDISDVSNYRHSITNYTK